MSEAALPMELILPLVDAALAEDVGSGDVTTTAVVPASAAGLGEILAQEAGVICGLPVAQAVFERLDSGVIFEADAADGDSVSRGTAVARVRGSARAILTAERTALNFLQHLSGIATAVARVARALEGTDTRILDTRKTVPGMRLLAKYAVRCGGGENHRRGLYDMVLIKENHIAVSGDVAGAVRRCRKAHPDLQVEVEVTSLRELEIALTAAPDRILLDNFEPSRIEQAAELVAVASEQTGRPRPQIEVSGGITPQNVERYALPGVDFISSGALTHSAGALDLSLEFRLLDPSRDETPERS